MKKRKFCGLMAFCMGVLAGCSVAGAGQPVLETENIVMQETYTDLSDILGAEDGKENGVEIETGTEGRQKEEENVPDIVMQKAEECVEKLYSEGWQLADTYTDWRIESLTHSYTYEDFEGMILQVYQLNYQFLFQKPEAVQLVGGMSVDEDGWVVTDYPNSHYLIFRQDGDALVYLCLMFENDCYPGDETFTSDLQRIYDMGKLTLGEEGMETDTKELAVFREGDMDVKAATRTFGEGYSIYLTDGDWERTGTDEWTAVLNQQVKLTIEQPGDKTTGQIEQELMDEGYVFEDNELVKGENDMIYKIRLNNAGWKISYCFPSDAEEGWGMLLSTIVDTFYVNVIDK